ncbi:hypothetical protein C5467_15720 [Photorhabdus khanii subsp. guanajuatensis]|uniref:Uncharacterized protein n=1 Tax=Photorhabdus khanii subsp. guanajuatensis TaxID=2100166 RepID=A0A4R4JFV4_9GAMM|nr:hypothetical protein C5467_15720 [Photorhabdus khanii subsp. guanajuatensis]
MAHRNEVGHFFVHFYSEIIYEFYLLILLLVKSAMCNYFHRNSILFLYDHIKELIYHHKFK